MEHDMTDSAAEPLDDLDQVVMDRLAEVQDALDPMPADLLDRVRFAVDLESLEVEVARFATLQTGVGARDADGVRTMTFEAETRSVMLTLTPTRDGTVRLDGWVAPASGDEVEVRAVSTTRRTTCDAHGRFVVDGIPHGLVQVVVRPAREGGGRSVVTPGFEV
jgi:hypothetical protein